MFGASLAQVKELPSTSATRNPIIHRGQGLVADLETVPFCHPIPDLPVLNQLTLDAKPFLAGSSLKPEETAIIGAQHILETTATLLGKFKELGFEIYITGKCYSTSPIVFNTMKQLGVHVWPGSKPEKLGEYQAACEKDIDTVLAAVESNSKIKNIIILDDGGRFYEKIPPYFRKKYRISGVEQTRAGFYSKNVALARMNIVNVAQSAGKVLFESPFIADAVVGEIMQITQQLDKDRCMIGIIGFGVIGRALTDRLVQDGFHVGIYDKDPNSYKNYFSEHIEVYDTIESLFMNNNFIIGCTGQDSTESFKPLSLNGHDRIIVSVSSEDKEFKSLLKTITSKNNLIVDTLSTIGCYTNSENSKIEILYGGFPVNFANSYRKPFNVPAERIALTQALLFAAVMQAISSMDKNAPTDAQAPANMMLIPELQQKVVKLWYETTINEDTLPHDLIKKFIADKAFVIANSKGLYDESCVTCRYVIANSSRPKSKL